MTFLSIFERYKFCFNTLIPLTGMETPARKRVRSKRLVSQKQRSPMVRGIKRNGNEYGCAIRS